MVNNDELPKPPAHVPKDRYQAWYDYWAKIYLDAEDTERENRYNERMMNGTGSRAEVEAD